MKLSLKPLALCAALALAGLLAANAQTNTTGTNSLAGITNTLSNLGLGSNVVNGVGFVANSLLDAQPYVKNGGILFEAGALKIGSSYGAYADIQLPLNTNSWQITYGTVFGYISNRLYSATLNVTLGTQVSIPGATNLPVVGKYVQPLYAFAESGPGYNFQAHQVVAQYFAGVKYLQPVGTNWGIGASYALGGISDLSNKVQEFSLFVTCPW